MLTLILISSNEVFSEIRIEINVDDKIITNYDLKNEVNYLEILNPNLADLGYNQKIEIAKNSLINQIIKQKEIKKLIKIDINNSYIDDYFKNYYLNLGFKNEKEFEVILKKKTNYSLSEIKKKVETELYWNDLIYNKYIKLIKIDEEKIISKINALNDEYVKEYLLSEIVISKRKNEPIENFFKEIQVSINEIGFNNTANIYSNSESSKFGGKIGWVKEINLSQIIKEKIGKIKKGEFTDLIKLKNNYLILKVEDMRSSKITFDRETEIKKLINLETNQQLNRFSKIYFNKIKLNYSINEK